MNSCTSEGKSGRARAFKTKEQALQDFADVVAEAAAIAARLSPEDAARRAWHPGGPSIEELTLLITESRERT